MRNRALSNHSQTISIHDSYNRLAEIDVPITRAHLYLQAKEICSLAWPVSLGYFLQMSLNMASVFTLGHVGQKELASCALATMYANVAGYSLGIGMSTALDTLCSQAHTSSNDPLDVGRHLQRGIVVSLVMTIPVSFLFYYCETILLLAGQDAEISRLAGLYIIYLIPSIFPYFVYECMKRFLQCQGIMKGILFVIFIASPINMFLQWFFVFGPLNYGFIGSPIALCITYFLLPVLLRLYMYFFNVGHGWGGFEVKEMFDTMKIMKFLKLGIPGILMICSEWWAFEIIALAAGWIGEVSLATQSIILNTSSLSYMLPLGISIATTTRVGNALGNNAPNLARAASRSALIVALTVAFFNSFFFIVVRNFWGNLWTDSPEVIDLVSKILPIAALYQLNDGMNAIGGGVFRGCGHQKVGAVFNFVGFYVIGIPLALYLAFDESWKLGLMGLWGGVIVGLFLVTILQMTWIFTRIDWEAEAILAHGKVLLDEGEEERLLNGFENI